MRGDQFAEHQVRSSTSKAAISVVPKLTRTQSRYIARRSTQTADRDPHPALPLHATSAQARHQLHGCPCCMAPRTTLQLLMLLASGDQTTHKEPQIRSHQDLDALDYGGRLSLRAFSDASEDGSSCCMMCGRGQAIMSFYDKLSSRESVSMSKAPPSLAFLLDGLR